MLYAIFETIENIQDSLNSSIDYLGYSYILEDKEERDFICKEIKAKINLLKSHLDELINYE